MLHCIQNFQSWLMTPATRIFNFEIVGQEQLQSELAQSREEEDRLVHQIRLVFVLWSWIRMWYSPESNQCPVFPDVSIFFNDCVDVASIKLDNCFQVEEKLARKRSSYQLCGSVVYIPKIVMRLIMYGHFWKPSKFYWLFEIDLIIKWSQLCFHRQDLQSNYFFVPKGGDRVHDSPILVAQPRVAMPENRASPPNYVNTVEGSAAGDPAVGTFRIDCIPRSLCASK